MYFPALLNICVLSMLSLVDGIPIHQDNLKNLVKLQADTIIYRIEEHNNTLKLSPMLFFGDPERYPEIPTDKPIQGITSIVETLTIFQKVLQKLPNGHMRQLRSDLTTLLGYLKDRMASMQCTPKKPTNGKSLDVFLEENATHYVTVGYMTLDRLKPFMQKLISNLDQLKSC